MVHVSERSIEYLFNIALLDLDIKESVGMILLYQ
jgi:hypothetical protein